MNRKGDISRYILWLIILLIITIVILALFYSAGITIIQDMIKKKLFGGG